MGTIREGRWDCASCGTKGNLGRDTDCPNCGKPRGPNVEFYLPSNAPKVTDEKSLKEAKAGPDWYCEHCGASSRASQITCDNCGAPKGDSQNNRVGDYIPPPKKEPTRTKQIDPDSYSYASTRDQDNSDEEKEIDSIPRSNRRKTVITVILIASVALLSILVYAFFKTKNVPLTLDRVTWEREIEIEKYKTVIEEGWDVPTGGRVIKSERKIRDYKKVLDHYDTKSKTERVQTGTETEEYNCGQKDLGNGFFEDKICERQVPVYTDKQVEYQEPVYREEPIYDDWYKYEIERWKPERTLNTAGVNLKPYWPEVKLAEKERQGKSDQKYMAYFHDSKKNKTYELKMDLVQWQKLQLNGIYNGKVNAFGLLRQVAPLEQ